MIKETENVEALVQEMTELCTGRLAPEGRSLTRARKIVDSVRNPKDFLRAYKYISSLCKDSWEDQSQLPTSRLLALQKVALFFGLRAPEVLRTSEQREEEAYLRKHRLDCYEEMLRIRLTGKYDAMRP